MSDVKTFIIKKTTPSDILFTLSPLSNQSLNKEIFLTDRMPQQILPLDWALGIFLNTSLYNMYKKGYFTFNDNAGVVAAAREAGVYFDEVLDFTPTTTDFAPAILRVLKSGVRNDITNAIAKHGKETVQEIAIKYADQIPSGVISMLETLWHIQLVMDER